MADPALDARDWLSRQLDPWLVLCASHGYAVGLREHRLCRALVLRLQAHRQWPAGDAERLACLAPLLCRDPEQQVGYATLIKQFLQTREQTGRVPDGQVPVAGNRTRWLVALCVGLVCLLAVGLGGLLTRPSVPVVEPPAPVASQPAPPASGGLQVDRPRPDPVGADGPPIYVPQRPFASQAPVNRSWVQPLRNALLLLAAISAAFTAWQLRRRRQRRSYAESRSVPEQRIAQRHMLRARHTQGLALPASLMVPTARLLRQRSPGSQQQVDARATIAASVRQGGFLAWRYAARSLTPEYLVLIDDAGADDQQARFHEAMVDALSRRGVAMDVFHFRQSPSVGCWRWSKSTEAEVGEPLQPRDRTSFAALVARYPAHRLLVFGGTASAVRTHDGQPSDWTHHARQLGLRAWFTPLPVRSWGEVERWVTSAQGLDFLLLPMEPAALQSWAGWLASGRASLRQDARSPLAFPPLLQLQPHAWGQRGVAPPAAIQAQLIDELGRYLGPRYTPWLAACAVFPALAWPFTLSMGRLVLGHRASTEHAAGMVADEADLAIGAGALAALPWFREGRLPDWLRQQLLQQLPADLHELLRQHLLKQLGETPSPDGTDIAPLARLRRMLGGGRGPLADVLLLRFLEPALAPALAARLPEWVRQLLFSQGSALMGMRPAVAWLMALPMLGAVAAWPAYWDGMVPAQTWMASQAQIDAAMPTPLSGVAWAPDGSLLAIAGVDGKLSLHLAAQSLTETVEPRSRLTSLSGSKWSPLVVALTDQGQAVQWAHVSGRWDQRSLADKGIAAAALHPGGDFAALGTVQGDVLLVELSGSTRRLIAAPAPPAPVLALAVHAQGQRVAAVDAQGRLALAVASPNLNEPTALLTANALQAAAVAFSPDGSTLAVAGGDGRVQLRSATTLDLARELAPPPGAPVAALTGLTYSADGSRLAASNAEGGVLVWNVASGELIALLAAPGAAPVRDLSFTADGSGLTGLNADGRAWRWGDAMPTSRLALLGCFTVDQRGNPAVPAAAEARALADRWSAAAADSERVLPVAISPALFDRWNYGSGLPGSGTLQVAVGQQAAGNPLRARLQAIEPIEGSGWILDAVSSAAVPAANACKAGPPPPPPVQCPDPVNWPQESANAERQQALREALAGIWAPNLASRAPATDRVIAGGDLVSDLVPLAANQALGLARGPQPGQPNAQSRITRALSLALQASPLTLQRHSADLCALALAAQPLSDSAADLSRQLLARLQEAKGRQPRLQITVTDPERLREAQTLQARLRSTLGSQGGIDIQVAQRAAAPSDAGSGLITWGRSQQALARWLARQAAVPGTDSKAAPTPLPLRHQALPADENPTSVDRYELVLAPATELVELARFRDCNDDLLCPWMVVMPFGRTFQMGSPMDEPGRHDDEDPQHPVTLQRRFAIMETEVTRGQFAAFVKVTGHQVAGGCLEVQGGRANAGATSWRDAGFDPPQDDSHPVVCVAWADAQAYAAWLSRSSGQNYRLPSEAEWEFAARGATSTPYSFGRDVAALCRYANVADRSHARKFSKDADAGAAKCDDGYPGTAPVRQFGRNPFGLYDMHGNVWEWVQDCYHGTYAGAPGDGSAWVAQCGNDERRVVRGGGWNYIPRSARSAMRFGDASGNRDNFTGFRLARTLSP